MSAPQPTIWSDDQPPDPAWQAPREPSAGDLTAPRRRGPHPVAVLVLALALVLGSVWAAGGFEERTDLRIDTRPGQLIATGPYEFTFTRATAQRLNRFGSEWVVQVLVHGTGRTTGDEAITPSTLNPMFAAADERTRESHDMEGQRFGSGATYGSSGSSFTPGLAPVDYIVTFEFSDNYRPGAELTFAVFELEYTDTSLLGTGEKTWNNADRRYVLRLPVTSLPDRD